MNKTGLSSILMAVALLAVGVVAEAQQPKKVPRIGYVGGTDDPSTPGGFVNALRQGLRDLGYIEGKNILFEYRSAEGKSDRYPSLVTELLQLKVDVLVSPDSRSDPRSHAGNQDDPHRYGDYCGSSRVWVHR
jgi:putative ABC transport system substrate-binding protein